jgi:Clr5 domain
MEATIEDSMNGQAASTSVNNNTVHKADEWEYWRPLITQLYLTENRTLKVVRQLLAEQHDFHPTYGCPEYEIVSC